MSTKKDSGSIGLASYLSPSDLQKAVRLTNEVKSARRVEDVLRYQKQLAFLMAKAERNKKHQERITRRRERIIRNQALQMKNLDRQQIKERYARLRGEPAGMVMVGGDLLSKESDTVVGTHYKSVEEAVVGAKRQTKEIPKHFKLKMPNGNEKNG